MSTYLSINVALGLAGTLDGLRAAQDQLEDQILLITGNSLVVPGREMNPGDMSENTGPDLGGDKELDEEPETTTAVPGAECGSWPATCDLSAGLDKSGLPWDSRIGSANKGKLAKTGIWKVARNRDAGMVADVLAELTSLLGVEEGALTETAAPVAGSSIPPASGGIPSSTVPAAAPDPVLVMTEKAGGSTYDDFMSEGSWTEELLVDQGFAEWKTPEPETQTSTVPAAGAGEPITTFPALMALLTQRQSVAVLGPQYAKLVAPAVRAVGVESLALLNNQPDMIPTVAAALEEEWNKLNIPS